MDKTYDAQFSTRVPSDLAQGVSKFVSERGLESRSEGVRRLVKKGIEAEKNPPPLKKKPKVALSMKVPEWLRSDVYALEMLTNYSAGELLEVALNCMGAWITQRDAPNTKKAKDLLAHSFLVNCVRSNPYTTIPVDEMRVGYEDWCLVFNSEPLNKKAFAATVAKKFKRKSDRFLGVIWCASYARAHYARVVAEQKDSTRSVAETPCVEGVNP